MASTQLVCYTVLILDTNQLARVHSQLSYTLHLLVLSQVAVDSEYMLDTVSCKYARKCFSEHKTLSNKKFTVLQRKFTF